MTAVSTNPDGSVNYQCDYPGCTAPTFIESVGYSFPAYVAMTGNSQVGSFMCPNGQHICCSVNHAQSMMDYCYSNHLLPDLENQATTKGTTLQMTPP